jgi:hypothetical protein
MSPRGTHERGSTVIEALVAVVLVAFAGAVVASAAQTSLRATRAAAVLEQLTAGAAADLARAEARGAPVGVDDQVATDPTLGAGVEHRVTITRSADVATLEARVVVPGADPFVLVTRQYVPQ